MTMNYKTWLRCVVLVFVQIHSSMIGKCPYVDLSKGKRQICMIGYLAEASNETFAVYCFPMKLPFNVYILLAYNLFCDEYM